MYSWFYSYDGIGICLWEAPPPPRVTLETSAMIASASLHAWYIRRVSSLFRASSALSSIMFCYRQNQQFIRFFPWTLLTVSPVAYRLASSSPLMNCFASLTIKYMMILGTWSLQDVVTIFMYESTRFLIVSTCLSSWGSTDSPLSALMSHVWN